MMACGQAIRQYSAYYCVSTIQPIILFYEQQCPQARRALQAPSGYIYSANNIWSRERSCSVVHNTTLTHDDIVANLTISYTIMSRRPPNPAADRTVQNQQALKNLVKVESNKSCADCKKNKREPSSSKCYAIPANTLNRSSMGKLESWYFHMHSVRNTYSER